MAAGLVDTSGALVARASVPTRPSAEVVAGGSAAQGAELLFGDLAELVGQVTEASEGRGRLLACGAGCGGPMSPGGVEVSPLNIPAWRDFPLRARLAELTGLATFVDNDAKALALGEGWVGAAKGRADYVALVVSTGVGGGHRARGPVARRSVGERRPHRARDRRARRARVCLRRARVPRGRGLGHRAGRCHRPTRPAGAPGHRRRAPARWSDAPSRRWSTCSTCPSPSSAGRSRWASGSRSFSAAQAEMDARCGLSFARGARVVPGGLGDAGPLVGAGRVGLLGAGQAA